MESDLAINANNTCNKRFDDQFREESATNSHPLRRATDRILQQARAFVESLEIIGDGVILVNSDSTVSFVSQSARTILNRMGSLIEIGENNAIVIKEKTNGDRFDDILKKIRTTAERISISEVLVINHVENPSRPLILSLCSLSTAGEEPRLMLIFRDPDMEPTPQWQIFTNHFNLSAQEARLSLALADGLSISEYSEAFHVSQHTARTHLKSIFFKTSTRRQADLIRLIFTFTRL